MAMPAMQSTHDSGAKPHCSGKGQPPVGRPSAQSVQLRSDEAAHADRLGQPGVPRPGIHPMQAGARPHHDGSGHDALTLPASHAIHGHVQAPPHAVTLGQPTLERPTTQPLHAGTAGPGPPVDDEEPRWTAGEDDDDEVGDGGDTKHAAGSGQSGVGEPAYTT